MTRVAVALLLLAFAVAGLAVTARAQQDPAPQDETPAASDGVEAACAPDRVLVKVRPGVDAAAAVARHGGTIVQTIPGIDVQVVTVPAGTGQQTVDALNLDPDVQYAEPDQIVRTQDGEDGHPCP